MLNVAFSNESLWFSDFMPRAPLLWIIHWQIKHEFCCRVFLFTLTRPEFTIWVQANLKTSEKEGGRCRRRWRNSPSNPGWVSEWETEQGRTSWRERERERETGRACPVLPCRLFSLLANHSTSFPSLFLSPCVHMCTGPTAFSWADTAGKEPTETTME